MNMESIRIAFIDLDGTLLWKDHETVSERVHRSAMAAHEAGLLLAVATGRCRALIPPSVWALPFDYYLTSNGADVYRPQDKTHPVRMPLGAGDALLAWEILKPFGFFTEWYIDGGIGIDEAVYGALGDMEMPHWHREFFAAGHMRLLPDIDAYLKNGAAGLEKINMVYCDDMEQRAQAIGALNRTGRFALSSSLGRNIEVNDPICTKGEAIRRLCAQLGIPTAQAMAFGDGNNDIEMLQAVGLGIAMGNAQPGALAAAAAVTETNERDGVGIELERWVSAQGG